ncbi:ATPase, T2SS/T4P/T4SS family (plasmid) [Dyella sp. BiH032]|uniref:ATPase, T2SS/T4P/T4SS family n=1 Tax=Dyella sp. BiH032 TaxID=3075430 RepID=UPI0028931DE8|nr:ATPase, T2SS/T4P/T4SS family [Dyella sp. BiH032]WNL48553.1 ATPase, T2SS/T4P/T4SS family [Dyella sp. BiH032]
MGTKGEMPDLFTEVLSNHRQSVFYLSDGNARADVVLVADITRKRGELLISSERRGEGHVMSYEHLVECAAPAEGLEYTVRITHAAEIADVYRGAGSAGDDKKQDDVKRQQEVLSYLREGRRRGASEARFITTPDRAYVRYVIRGESFSNPAITKEQGEALQNSLYNSMTDDAGIQLNRAIYQDANLRREFAEKAGLTSARISTFPLKHKTLCITVRLFAMGGVNDMNLWDAPYTDAHKRIFKSWVRRRRGGVIVSGPTGSGKTTWAKMFMEAKAEHFEYRQDWFTVENPVELELHSASIFQGPLPVDHQDDEDIGPAWKRSKRALMRQAPRGIYPGEARDEDSAKFVVDVSNTGHFALSTTHTQSADAILSRFEHEFGVHPMLLLDPAVVIGLMNQDLVRTICPDCAAPLRDHHGLFKDREDLARVLEWVDGDKAMVGLGCENCAGSGSAGRRPVCELVDTNVGYMKAYRDGGATGARLYWIEHMGGRTKMMHTRELINAGLVDPRHAEVDVDPLDHDRTTLGIGPEFGFAVETNHGV